MLTFIKQYFWVLMYSVALCTFIILSVKGDDVLAMAHFIVAIVSLATDHILTKLNSVTVSS